VGSPDDGERGREDAAGDLVEERGKRKEERGKSRGRAFGAGRSRLRARERRFAPGSGRDGLEGEKEGEEEADGFHEEGAVFGAIVVNVC
jgi:hypothetical protein